MENNNRDFFSGVPHSCTESVIFTLPHAYYPPFAFVVPQAHMYMLIDCMVHMLIRDKRKRLATMPRPR